MKFFLLEKKYPNTSQEIKFVRDIIKFVLATVVLYMANTYPQKPKDKTIPPKNPGKPESLNALNVFLFITNY